MKEYCESCGCKFDGEETIRSKSYRNRCRSCVASQTRQKRAGITKETNKYVILGKALDVAEKEMWRTVTAWLGEFDKLEYDAAGTIWGWKNGERQQANIHLEIQANMHRAIVTRKPEEK